MTELEFRLDKDSPVPLYRQIGEAVYRMVETGALPPNTRLPAIRTFARSLGVNTVTVVNAYKYLENRRAVHSITGSGTYVSERDIFGENAADSAILRKSGLLAQAGSGGLIDFTKGSTSKDLFPVREFKEIFNEVLDRDRGEAFGYEEGLGYKPLREAFRGYMAGFGVQTDPDRVHVISGAQQGVDIVSKILLRPGDAVLTESLTYLGAAAAFASRGANVYGVPMTTGGIDTARLEAAARQLKPRLFYCMPYFQTPTCLSYSMENKRELIELAYKYNFFILEEDIHGDFNYKTDAVIRPLKAFDYRNRVIYIKSFSKILMPGLRMGFTLMPREISEAALAAKHTADIDTSGFLQRVFHLFMQSGRFYAHAEKMRGLYKAKYENALLILKRSLGGALNFSEPGGGLNFWLPVPGGRSPGEFFNALGGEGVAVSPGSMFSLSEDSVPHFKISFADITDKELESGVNIIKRVCGGR